MSQTIGPPPHDRGLATTGPGPEPARLAGLLARAWLEVRARRRPLAQLEPLLAPAVVRRLKAQVVPCGAGDAIGAARVRRVRASHPSVSACEAVVLVDHGARTTAIAVRLERHRGRWRAVEIAAPESGLPALRTSSSPVGRHLPDAFDEVFAEVGEDA